MCPRLKIKLLVPVFTFLLSVITSYGQTLKFTNLNLNSGGVIYDVADVPLINCYVVVGDFTEIGGVTGFSNIAFIDKDDFTVNVLYTTNNIFKLIDAPIYTVEVFSTYKYGPPTWIPKTTDYIYIGGKFTTIGTIPAVPHSKLALIKFEEIGTTLTYAVDAWDPNIEFGAAFPYVNDLEIKGDTLVFAGDFLDFVDGSQFGLGAYSVPGHNLLPY